MDDLIIVGKMREEEKSHQKKVQKFNKLIEMRMERKKQVKELIAKRAGAFQLKDDKM